MPTRDLPALAMDAPDLTDAEALTFLRGQMAALEEPPTALQLNTWLEQSCRRGFFECVGFLVEERGVAPEDHVPLTEAYTYEYMLFALLFFGKVHCSLPISMFSIALKHGGSL